MRSRRNKLSVFAMSALVLGIGLTPSTAKPRFADQGSFTATGLPLGFLVSPVTGDQVCGKDGVNHTTYAYTPRVDGVLDVTIKGFKGDWDLFLFDFTTNRLIAYGARDQILGEVPEERISWRVVRHEKLGIIACNSLSPDHQVVVEYALTAGDGFSAGPAARSLSTLRSGGLPKLREVVPVNIVLLGYSPRQVNASKLLDGLPKLYRPHVRMPSFYAKRESLGISYTYQYNLKFSDASYNNRFFSMLRSIGKLTEPTIYQKKYNEQVTKHLTITENLDISAYQVERWLGKNAPAGVDTTRDTVFFINWYGRHDFKFHLYRKLGHPNVDTGLDFGTRDHQTSIAAGGSPPALTDEPAQQKRVWFYDLSAGPEAWTRNYMIDTKDINKTGEENYRMPPIWEYRADGYRDPSELTSDLGKVARYVAINLLFTTSPLYSPSLAPPALPESVSLRLNWLEGRPNAGVSAVADAGVDPRARDAISLQTPTSYVKAKDMQRSIQRLLPLTKVRVEETTSSLWRNEELSRCFALFSAPTWAPSCYAGMPYSNFQGLYVYHALHAPDELKSEADYAVGVHTYFVPDNHLNYGIAYADNNHRDGTQSMVNYFPTQTWLTTIGTTLILTHELGHHFAMSHPHDGYDYEKGIDYSMYDDRFAFVGAGDESNSVMGYMWTNPEFSQFDLDNHDRWMTSAYLSNANTLVSAILRGGHAEKAASSLQHADALAAQAVDEFAAHNYLAAHRAAHDAYKEIRGAARAAGVEVRGSAEGLRIDSNANAAIATLPRPPAAINAMTDRITGVEDGVPIFGPQSMVIGSHEPITIRRSSIPPRRN
ncbi:MAG: hypothetical protein NVSMB57_05440 [Actinomycetota bacterium]